MDTRTVTVEIQLLILSITHTLSVSIRYKLEQYILIYVLCTLTSLNLIAFP